MNQEKIIGFVTQYSIIKFNERIVFCKLFFHMHQFRTKLQKLMGKGLIETIFRKFVNYLQEKYFNLNLNLEFRNIFVSLTLAPLLTRFYIKRTRETMKNSDLDQSGLGEDQLKFQKNPMPILVIPEADEDIQKTVNTLLSKYREEYIQMEKERVYQKKENEELKNKLSAEKKESKKTIEMMKKLIFLLLIVICGLIFSLLSKTL